MDIDRVHRGLRRWYERARRETAGRRPAREPREEVGLLLGYGTLLHRESLARTVGEPALERPLTPAVVPGYRRLFNVRPGDYEPSYRLSRRPIEAAAMNIEAAPGAWLNGLLFAVSEVDLEALDARESGYRRIRVAFRSCPGGTPVGEAFTYLAGPDAPGICRDPSRLMPRWRDVVLARAGAYAVGRAFGEMFDRTTYLADGESPMIDVYGPHLPEPGDG